MECELFEVIRQLLNDSFISDKGKALSEISDFLNGNMLYEDSILFFKNYQRVVQNNRNKSVLERELHQDLSKVNEVFYKIIESSSNFINFITEGIKPLLLLLDTPDNNVELDNTDLQKLYQEIIRSRDNCKLIPIRDLNISKYPGLSIFYDMEIQKIISTLSTNLFYKKYISDIIENSSIESCALTRQDLASSLMNIKENCKETFEWNEFLEMNVWDFYEEFLYPVYESITQPNLKMSSDTMKSVLLSQYSLFAEIPNENTTKIIFRDQIVSRVITFNSVFKIRKLFLKLQEFYRNDQDKKICFFPNDFFDKSPSLNKFLKFAIKDSKEFKHLSLKQLLSINSDEYPIFNNPETYLCIFWTSFYNLYKSSEIFTGKALNDPLQIIFELISNKEEFNNLVFVLHQSFLTDKQRSTLNCLVPIVQLLKEVTFTDNGSKTDYFAQMNSQVASYLSKNIKLIVEFEDSMRNYIEDASHINELLKDLRSTNKNSPVPEFELVNKLINKSHKWFVNKDTIELHVVNIYNISEVATEYVELKLASSKMNITMIDSDVSKTNYQSAHRFVQIFQDLETLKNELMLMSHYYQAYSTKSYEFFGLGDDDNNLNLKEIISTIHTQRCYIDFLFSDNYKNSLTRFTQDHLCMLYKAYAERNNEKFKRIIFGVSQKYFNNEQFNAKLDQLFNFDNMSFEEFLTNLKSFNCKLNNLIVKSPPMFTISTEGFKWQTIENTRSCTLNVEEDEGIKGITGLIFYLFFKSQIMKNNENMIRVVPDLNQLLICTREITSSQLETFYSYFSYINKGDFSSNTNDIIYFILVNPHELDPIVYKTFIKILNKDLLNEKGNGRFIIIEDDKNYINNNLFPTVRKNLRFNFSYPDIENIYFREDSEDCIQSYMIYNPEPRVGKSQLLLRQIFLIENHLYYRILIDENTTLKQLIIMLNKSPHLDGYKTCIHLNIDGNINSYFNFYIQELLIFRTLNDWQTLPYLHQKDTIYLFEFGSINSVDEEEFKDKFFPIGKYMPEIQNKNMLSNPKSIFTFNEYVIIENLENHFSYVDQSINEREYIADAAALIKLYNKNTTKQFLDLGLKLVDKFNSYKKKLLSNPISAYDLMVSFLEYKRKETQNPEKSKILMSHISDVSKMIFRYKEIVLGTEILNIEIKTKVPLRYIGLECLLNTAYNNCGDPYSNMEEDMKIFNILKSIGNEPIMIALTPFSKVDTKYIVLQPLKQLRIIKNLKIPPEVSFMFRMYKEWSQIESNPIEMHNQLGEIFGLANKITFIASKLYLMWTTITSAERDKLNTFFSTDDSLAQIVSYEGEITENLIFEIKKWILIEPKYRERLTRIVTDLRTVLKSNQVLNVASLPRSIAASDLMSKIHQYVLKESRLLSYSLSLYSIRRFLHVAYRLASGVPIVLMGETGSGKSFSIDFLKEIISDHSQLIINMFNGGTTEESIKELIYYHIDEFKKHYDIQQHLLIFFFDEVNTAPCQWFLKELIIDRTLEGKPIPSYVQFICAVNPARKLPDYVKKQMRGLDPITQPNGDNGFKDLVYKVHKLPRSFIPYLFPADPPRDKPADIECITSLNEYEKIVYKVSSLYLSQESIDDTVNISGQITHFSRKKKFSMQINESFFKPTKGNDPSELFQSFSKFVSEMNVYAYRLLTSNMEELFYRDFSFASIRECERCSTLIRWFYQFGMFEQLKNRISEENKMIRLRKAFMLAFATAYWVRLSDFRLDDKMKPERDRFLDYVVSFWERIDMPSFMKPPTTEEWTKCILDEQMNYANLFVDEDEGLSKNKALCENIWATYICVSNNIPLWIIGLPGTSKTLAVNIVLSKLFSKDVNSSDGKHLIQQLPALIYQSYMCSKTSRSEALIEQLTRIAQRSQSFKTADSICVQILEEIGHADLSPYLPLKCLHEIIDNGFRINNESSINVCLIGLSNYKMDSAKLNRGILINRDELNQADKVKTAKDIFKSTLVALKKKKPQLDIDKICNTFNKTIEIATTTYHSQVRNVFTSSMNFFGLRDFYGFIRALARCFGIQNKHNISEIIQAAYRNFSGSQENRERFIRELIKSVYGNDDVKYSIPTPLELISKNMEENVEGMKQPLMRHMMIIGDVNSSLTILKSMKELQENKCHILYADNFTELPDDEWMTNDMTEFTKAMTKGEIVIFIGNHHLCFDSLYDTFNLRYQMQGKSAKTLISFAGDSYSVFVHPKFRTLILIEEKEYVELTAPFLNRFEKIHLNYSNVLSSTKEQVTIRTYENIIRLFGEDVRSTWNDQHSRTISFLLEQLKKQNEDIDNDKELAFMFFNSQPSQLLYTMNEGNSEALISHIVHLSFSDYEFVHSTIYHIIQYYNDNHEKLDPLFLLWEDKSKKYKGIQAIALVPFVQEPELGMYGTVVKVDFTDRLIKSQIYNELSKINNETAILFLIIKQPLMNQSRKISQFQTFIEQIRVDGQFQFKILHTFITVDMSNVNAKSFQFCQSLEWPVFYLDSCFKSLLRSKQPPLSSIGINQLVFEKMFNQSIDKEKFISYIMTQIKFFYHNESAIIDIVMNDQRAKDLVFGKIEQILVEQFSHNDRNTTWVSNQLKLLSIPPPSLLDYFSGKLAIMVQNTLSFMLKFMLDGFVSIDDDYYAVAERVLKELLPKARQYMKLEEPQMIFIETRFDNSYPCLMQIYSLILDGNTNFNELIVDDMPLDFYAAFIFKYNKNIRVPKANKTKFREFLIIFKLICEVLYQNDISKLKMRHDFNFLINISTLYMFVSEKCKIVGRILDERKRQGFLIIETMKSVFEHEFSKSYEITSFMNDEYYAIINLLQEEKYNIEMIQQDDPDYEDFLINTDVLILKNSLKAYKTIFSRYGSDLKATFTRPIKLIKLRNDLEELKQELEKMLSCMFFYKSDVNSFLSDIVNLIGLYYFETDIPVVKEWEIGSDEEEEEVDE